MVECYLNNLFLPDFIVTKFSAIFSWQKHVQVTRYC